MHGVPFRHSEVDGIPCFWADGPGPAAAGLLFRVGRADEQLASGGITGLVQRTALAGFGGRRYDYDGAVDLTTTTFWATGEPEDVAEFVRDVGRALSALDGSPFAPPGEEPTTLDRMLMMRFGAAGHGLAFYEPFGLRKLGPDDAREWARRWFTRGNAALWMTRPPPAGLRIDLPDGPRVPPPPPQPIPGLELPAFAAAGDDVIASTMIAPRSAAIGVAHRAVAGRVPGTTTWQFPLTGQLTHRFLSVEPESDTLASLVAAFDAVAADGPSGEELDEGTQATVEAITADEAVPGGLERMAVDELLGAPRRWKEDLVREARSVSYAEAAAALREALTTQILLAPASAPKPGERYHDFPWFSRERIEGMTLRPSMRGQGVRLVASQEGVSHVAEGTGHASTVRYADVAAALQEPDGSLTLIGRDGAIVPIDPNSFKDAGRVATDLELRLAPELIVPPREAGRLELIARRKLRPGMPMDAELRLLRDRLDHQEQVVTMSEAVVGFKRGLLTLTDRRLIWLHRGPRDPLVRELPYAHVLDVKLARIPSQLVTIKSPAGETSFSQIQPKERAAEIVEEIRRRRTGQ